MAPPPRTVSIRPDVGMLSVLRHLNYKPWYAIAEFVDNAIQSHLSNRERLANATPPSLALNITIFLGTDTDNRIVIRDDAAGIGSSDYDRAFKPASAPLDKTGLSEFGMGMKSAACWFAKRWTVRTAALGESIERTVSFDIKSIVETGVEELAVSEVSVGASAHYTEITLADLYNQPLGRTRSKIRAHLASIYRVYLRQGWLRLIVDEEPLHYASPAILTAPYYADPRGAPRTWRKDIHFDLGNGLEVEGFAALRAKGNTNDAGFALFRRGRLIEGSGEEGYRPEFIFGRGNSYRSQRLFGELELRGFEVSHTKDGFRWDENEESFLELLKEELDSDPLPLLDQAEEYRVLRSREELAPGAAKAAEHTAKAVELLGEPAVEQLAASASKETPESLPESAILVKRDARIRFRGSDWIVSIETTNDPAIGDCFEVSDTHRADRRIEARLSLAHPFIQKWVGSSSREIEPFLRMAAGLALAEVCAALSGISMAGTVRRNLNELLRTVLSMETGGRSDA